MSETNSSVKDSPNRARTLRRNLAALGTIGAATIGGFAVGRTSTTHESTPIEGPKIEYIAHLYNSAVKKARTISQELHGTLGHPNKPLNALLFNGMVEFTKDVRLGNYTAHKGGQSYGPFLLEMGAKKNSLEGAVLGIPSEAKNGSIEVHVVPFDPSSMRFSQDQNVLYYPLNSQPDFAISIPLVATKGMDPNRTSAAVPTMYLPPDTKGPLPPLDIIGAIQYPVGDYGFGPAFSLEH